MKIPCSHIPEQLIDLMLGQLNKQQKNTVNLHLDSCSVCQSYFEQLRNQEKELEHMGTQLTDNLEEKQEKVIKALNTLPHRFAPPDRTIWSIIVHSKITKPLAAAIVLIAVGISLIYWQSHKEIQIPPELAQMPVEELIKIHKGDAESPYDSIVVKAALEKALNNIPAREIITLADKFLIDVSGPRGSGQRIYTPGRPVTEMIEAPPAGSPIAVSDHCFSCTAGSGFT